MSGVVEIGEYAFYDCSALSALELGKLEIIGRNALFVYCKFVRSSATAEAYHNCRLGCAG